MNYIHLMNWFWDEVPYREGYKSEYGSLFLAIVDSCNRNGWRATSVEYDRMINKVRIGKRMYYEALKWLQHHELVHYKPGRNEYAAAVFDLHNTLKAEVQKCTSTAPQQHLNSTTASTSTAPIIDKPLNSKTDKQYKKIERVAAPFESVLIIRPAVYRDWKAYSAWITAEANKIKFPSHWNGQMIDLYKNSWLGFRQRTGKFKKKLEPNSIQKQIESLSELNEEQLQSCITNSIANGYQGLFPDKYKKAPPIGKFSSPPRPAPVEDNILFGEKASPELIAQRKQEYARRQVEPTF